MRDGPGQGGLPDLSRPRKGHGREEPEVVFYVRTRERQYRASLHPCNDGIEVRNCRYLIVAASPNRPAADPRIGKRPVRLPRRRPPSMMPRSSGNRPKDRGGRILKLKKVVASGKEQRTRLRSCRGARPRLPQGRERRRRELAQPDPLPSSCIEVLRCEPSFKGREGAGDRRFGRRRFGGRCPTGPEAEPFGHRARGCWTSNPRETSTGALRSRSGIDDTSSTPMPPSGENITSAPSAPRRSGPPRNTPPRPPPVPVPFRSAGDRVCIIRVSTSFMALPGFHPRDLAVGVARWLRMDRIKRRFGNRVHCIGGAPPPFPSHCSAHLTPRP